MTDVPADLAEAIAHEPPPQSDKLDLLRELCKTFVEKELYRAELEEKLAVVKTDLHQLASEILPEKMDEAGVGAIELEARGNYPFARVELRPFIVANIAASWDPDKRRAAFERADMARASAIGLVRQPARMTIPPSAK